MGHRHQDVAPGVADQALDERLLVLLAIARGQGPGHGAAQIVVGQTLRDPDDMQVMSGGDSPGADRAETPTPRSGRWSGNGSGAHWSGTRSPHAGDRDSDGPGTAAADSGHAAGHGPAGAAAGAPRTGDAADADAPAARAAAGGSRRRRGCGDVGRRRSGCPYLHTPPSGPGPSLAPERHAGWVTASLTGYAVSITGPQPTQAEERRP